MKTNHDSIVKSLRRLNKIESKKATVLRMQLVAKDMRDGAINEINNILISSRMRISA